MVEKLSHQRISIRTDLRKQQSPGGKTPAPVFAGRNPIRLSRMAASLARKFLHWLGA
jgi:hypothetical protein